MIQGLRARFARTHPWLPSGRAFGATNNILRVTGRAFGATNNILRVTGRAFGATNNILRVTGAPSALPGLLPVPRDSYRVPSEITACPLRLTTQLLNRRSNLVRVGGLRLQLQKRVQLICCLTEVAVLPVKPAQVVVCLRGPWTT